jgi:hypothetical protein
MPSKKRQQVSAQVVLRPASGKSPHKRAAITSENISEYLPSAEAAARAQERFASHGFEVGPVVANSFSITAPVETFEKVFGTRLILEGEGARRSVRAGSGSYELSLDSLPESLSESVEAVTFTPPPDFGPTSY